MDALSKNVGDSRSKLLAEKYANAIQQVPAKLYDLFGCLYIQNKTQENVAVELCYSEEHVRRLIKELTNYFANKSLQNEEVLKAINKLTGIQKETIIKHFYQEKSLRQIARERGVNEKTVRESYHSAIKRLGILLKDLFSE